MINSFYGIVNVAKVVRPTGKLKPKIDSSQVANWRASKTGATFV